MRSKAIQDRVRRGALLASLLAALGLSGCSRDQASTEPAAGAVTAEQPARMDAETTGDIDVPEFPHLPQIVVPDIVGVTPAQRALESSMGDIIDPVEGITVRPANCLADGSLAGDGGLTAVDEQGNVTRNGDEGLFEIAADGSGSANYAGGLITVNADGSGTINGSADGGGDDAIIRVDADGSGTYNGAYGLISLDGQGGGTWNGDSGLIINNGDGSGTWNGPRGLVTINADGSGTWNAPEALVQNFGDGTGMVGTPGREVAMPPLPRVPPAGRFPPLTKFAPPGAPCGFVITLADQVLFDFGRSDIRPDASAVLDVLASALQTLTANAMEIRGHTDARGSDDYNQALSERRAQAVLATLRERVPLARASATGYGESSPVAPNTVAGADNPAGRQRNRRVEIFVRI